MKRKLSTLLLILALLLGLISVALADYRWSSGTSGVWPDSLTWNGAVSYPQAGDTAVLNLGTHVTIDGTSEVCDEVDLASWSGNSDVVILDIINSGSLAVSGLFYVGVGASDVGVLNVDGSLTIGSHLQIGNGGNGTVNMNGGTIDISDHLVVANPWMPAQAGLLNLNAGVITAVNFAMNDALGVIDISGGKLRLLGDWTATLQPLINNGSLIGYNGIGSVNMEIIGGYTEVTATAPAPENILDYNELPDWCKDGYSIWKGDNRIYNLADRTKWSAYIDGSGSITLQALPGLVVDVVCDGGDESFPRLIRTMTGADWRNYKRLNGRMRVTSDDPNIHTRDVKFIFYDDETRHEGLVEGGMHSMIQQDIAVRLVGEQWREFSLNLDVESISRANILNMAIYVYENPPLSPNQFRLEIELLELEAADPNAVVFDGKEYFKHRYDPNDEYVYPVLTGARAGSVGTISTTDGLTVEIGVDGDIRNILVDGNSIGQSSVDVPTGVLIRDAFTNKTPVMLAGQVNLNGGAIEQTASPNDMDLDVSVEYRLDSGGNYIEIAGTLTDTRQMDRAVTVYVVLPVNDESSWQWGNSISSSRNLKEEAGEHPQIEVINTKYPLSSMSLDQQAGLSLAVRMDEPANYRIGYNPMYNLYYIAFDIGLVPDINSVHGKSLGSADFRVILYRHEPQWKFRSALDNYYDFFPQFFTKRTETDGGWGVWRCDTSPPSDYLDDGYRYSWGPCRDVYQWNNANGVYNLYYIEPEFYQQSMGDYQSAGNQRVLDRLNKIADGEQQEMDIFKTLSYPSSYAAHMTSNGLTLWGKTLEEFLQIISQVTLNSMLYDADGNPDFSVANRFWIGDSGVGAMFACNLDPNIPDGKGGFNTDISLNYQIQDVEAATGATVDGLALDSFLWTGYNFRREHFQYSDFPLTFSMIDDYKSSGYIGPAPAIGKVFSTIEWLDGLRSGYLKDKLFMGNIDEHKESLAFAAKYLDVYGIEGPYVSDPDFLRSMAYRKPITDLPYTPRPDWQTRHNLLHCVFPGDGHDRDLMKECFPQLATLSNAGWEPITYAAVISNNVRIERYGSGEQFYLVLYNPDENNVVDANVTIDLTELGLVSYGASELLTGSPLTVNGETFQISLEPLETIVVAVDGLDITAPTPNPMTWSSLPEKTGWTSIAMTASTAFDTAGVQYYFECIGNPDHDSGWQDSPVYEDTWLAAGTEYTYKVKARDGAAIPNETAYSSPASTMTYLQSDFEPDGDVDINDLASFTTYWLDTESLFDFVNSSFEDDDVPDGGTLISLPSGWTSGWGNMKVYDPSAGDWQIRYSPGETIPDGEQVFWFDSGAVGIRQTLNEIISTDTEYMVSVDVGAYFDAGNSWTQITLFAIDQGDNATQLLAFYVYEDTPPAGQGVQLIEGQWVTETALWNSAVLSEVVGQRLQVQLRGYLVDVDNVRATGTCGSPADMDNDCDVDLTDFAIFANHWLEGVSF